ncbi:MAG TPA: nuclear transport factor 2 family protein [Bryobacteraceae bacterium]|jgi:hypothetical protein
MKLNSIRQATVRAAVLGLCGIALASAPAARAEDKMTAQSLIDRQMILDQITRYYYNFGKVDRQSEESFYAEDGELILGTRHYKGKEGIRQAYNRAPAAPPAGAAAPSAAAPGAGAVPAAAAPPRERTAFNVAIENPLIIVHGDTATSQVIYTEYRQEKVGDPMKFTTQGKEYATWVKVNGQWLYKTRQIASGSNPPEGWKE